MHNDEQEEKESAVMRFLNRLYRPVFAFSLRRPKLAISSVLCRS
jgi:Cu/Ag efflux pump CusA